MATRLDVWPTPELDASGGRTKITDPYLRLSRGDYRDHFAVDVGTDDGMDWATPILAPFELQVVHYQYDGPYTPQRGHTAGHNVWLRGSTGSRHKAFHLAGEPTVPLNVTVRPGTQIAAAGNSGTLATHAHFEEHSGSWSNPIDPTAAFRECLAAGRFAGRATNPIIPIPTNGDDDDMDSTKRLMLNENTGEVFLVWGIFKHWIKSESLPASEIIAGLLAAGVIDARNAPAAALLEGLVRV